MKEVSMPSGKTTSLQLIQLLRAIACLLVVFYHTTGLYPVIKNQQFFFGLFDFGFAGVDIFFVLSGFIITYTSIKFLGNRQHILVFLYKRFVRIFPTYWIITIGFLALQILLPSFYKTPFQLGFQNLVSTFFLFPGHVMVNGVSWTLTNELFFYLLFIVGFLIRHKAVLLGIIITYSLFIIGSYFWFFDFQKLSVGAQTFLHPMNIEFFIGILSAFMFRKLTLKSAQILLTAGIILFFGGAFINSNYIFAGLFLRVICYGIPALLIVLGAAGLERHRSVIVNKTWLSLGDASYSQYCYTYPS